MNGKRLVDLALSVPSPWKSGDYHSKVVKTWEKQIYSKTLGKLLKSRGACIFSENGEEDNRNKNETPIDAEFEVTWTNFGAVPEKFKDRKIAILGDYFDFDTECSPTAIAHSLAIEPWSRELFDRMRASHQTHYEQV